MSIETFILVCATTISVCTASDPIVKLGCCDWGLTTDLNLKGALFVLSFLYDLNCLVFRKLVDFLVNFVFIEVIIARVRIAASVG